MPFNKFLYHIQRCDKYQMLVRSILVYPSETMKFQSSEIPSFYFNFCCLLAHIMQNISINGVMKTYQVISRFMEKSIMNFGRMERNKSGMKLMKFVATGVAK